MAYNFCKNPTYSFAYNPYGAYLVQEQPGFSGRNSGQNRQNGPQFQSQNQQPRGCQGFQFPNQGQTGKQQHQDFDKKLLEERFNMAKSLLDGFLAGKCQSEEDKQKLEKASKDIKDLFGRFMNPSSKDSEKTEEKSPEENRFEFTKQSSKDSENSKGKSDEEIAKEAQRKEFQDGLKNVFSNAADLFCQVWPEIIGQEKEKVPEKFHLKVEERFEEVEIKIDFKEDTKVKPEDLEVQVIEDKHLVIKVANVLEKKFKLSEKALIDKIVSTFKNKPKQTLIVTIPKEIKKVQIPISLD